MSNFYKLLALLLLSSVSAFGQYMNLGAPGVRVGIGVSGSATTGILTLKSPASPGSTLLPIGLDHISPDGNIRIGTAVTNLAAYVQTHSNHPLKFATNNSNAQMILSTNGNVGIGTEFPLLAGLVVNKSIGATNALFGSNTSGVSIESNWPGLGLNTYYNGGRYAIANGYGGLLGLNMANGNLSLYSSSTTASAQQAINLSERLTLRPFGGVEIGNNGSNDASGFNSMAVGENNIASANAASALGSYNRATGLYSLAVGNGNTASGLVTTALGTHNEATGSYANALGFENTASGEYASTLGRNNTASGNASTAIGNWGSTAGFNGAMILSDNSITNFVSTSATAQNQFTSRFAGGYRLFTSSNASTGVIMGAGGNAWLSISDSTKKERFLPLNHADLLASIRTLKLGTWNYKGQRTERHYGPMAQDFFARFGHDALGVIGCDTLLNSHDFTAVTLSGVQALALENEQLKVRIAHLEYDRDQLNRERIETTARFEALERAVFVRSAPRTTLTKRRKQGPKPITKL